MKITIKQVREQSGVVPYRVRNGEIEFCLIKNKRGKWGIPKGGVEAGLGKKRSAEKEALEEAGIVGKADKRLGSYAYSKRDGSPQSVIMYAMKIRKVLNKWPEKATRKREFVSYEEAAKRLDAQLHPMLNSVRMMLVPELG